MIHDLLQKLGLGDLVGEHHQLLEMNRPYADSAHIRNIASNVLLRPEEADVVAEERLVFALRDHTHYRAQLWRYV